MNHTYVEFAIGCLYLAAASSSKALIVLLLALAVIAMIIGLMQK